MNRVEILSEKIATSIYSNVPNSDSSSIAVLKYSLVNLINLMIFMSVVLIISLFTGHFIEACIAIISFPLLRYFSGGLHFRNMTVCNIISSILVVICVYSSYSFWYTGFIFSSIALVILLFTAPSNVKRSTLDKKYYPVIKLIAVLIVSTNFFFHSDVFALVCFIQALTTVPVMQKLLDKYQI